MSDSNKPVINAPVVNAPPEADPIRSVVNTLLASTSPTAKLTHADRIPSNWGLSAGDEEFPLHGQNTVTGLMFKGTHEEFNQLLKG